MIPPFTYISSDMPATPTLSVGTMIVEYNNSYSYVRTYEDRSMAEIKRDYLIYLFSKFLVGQPRPCMGAICPGAGRCDKEKDYG